MGEIPEQIGQPEGFSQTDFDKITSLVSAEFQVQEALMENNVPTYYLRQPQETKQPFIRLLRSLTPMKLVALLRKKENRIVLKVVSKPPVKPSNVMINWILFFLTLGTTFYTGYILSSNIINPLIGGAAFTIAIMAILGMHEMGHKLTANRDGVEATAPYFIPGPPPIGGFLGIGTFGAVIMQKSLPRNRDSLFDVGASGPLVGFILAVVATIIGFPLSSYSWISPSEGTLPTPLMFVIIERFFPPIGLVPDKPPGDFVLGITPHPVLFAGWVGMLVTMLNLLPAAMLDGGHVSRSLLNERTRLVLTGLSIVFLILTGFVPMALFVIFIAMYRHPGPLDDVSGLSTGRKVLAGILIIVFVLSSFVVELILGLLSIFGV